MSKKAIVANVVALVALGGGLVYYNFVDKAAVSLIKVGAECPNFKAQTYKVEGDTFSLTGEHVGLSDQNGKVYVVNFWETWCSGCIKELPAFDLIQTEYKDSVEVIAVVGVTSTAQQAADWMNEKKWLSTDKESDWADFSLTFAYMPLTYCKTLGYTTTLPRTVIVDKEGIVAYAADGTMTHENLQNILADLV